MTEAEEDWVHLAMGDACLVADLLLRLLRHPPPSTRPWLDWTVRGRRTRPQQRNSDELTKKEATLSEAKLEQARSSPCNPLSWSGGTSTSGGGSEESPSPLDNCHPARSKAPLAAGAPTTTASAAHSVAACKRPRQKKRSLFELKEEESLLLKERRSLEQELASLRLRVEKERATNESLKRLKANAVLIQHGQPRGPSPCSEAETMGKALLPDLNLPLSE